MQSAQGMLLQTQMLQPVQKWTQGHISGPHAHHLHINVCPGVQSKRLEPKTAKPLETGQEAKAKTMAAHTKVAKMTRATWVHVMSL